MRYPYRFLLIVLLLMPSVAHAQKQNNVWYFGYGAGLDFNGSILGVLNDGKTGRSYAPGTRVTSTISDRSTGRLLFYTNGDTVWNRYHEPMPNGSALHGLIAHIPRAAYPLIVPFPGDSLKYYIFAVTENQGNLADPSLNGLTYSVVDMRLDNGRGDVVVRPQTLRVRIDETLCAIPQCGSDGYWLLVHGHDSAQYYAFGITRDGIESPVISQVGLPASPDWSNGLIHFSPDGTMVAATNAHQSTEHRIELFDFDRTTGLLSDPVRIELERPGSLCFSPDNTKLYATSWQLGVQGLHQFDVSRKDSLAIALSHRRLTASRDLHLGDMELGSDGVLYCANPNDTAGGTRLTQWLALVSFPNRSGDSCYFWPHGVDLSPQGTGSSLVNLVYPASYVLPEVSAGEAVEVCTGGSAQLHGAGGVHYRWSPADGLSCTDCPEPIATPTATTTYHLSVTNATGCTGYDSVTVSVVPYPNVSISADTALCPGSAVALHAGGGTLYRWSPAAGLSCADCPDPVAQPDTTTTYRVTVANDIGCASVDSVTVTVLDLPIANAGADTSICAGTSLQLQAGDGARWQWSPADDLDCLDCRNPVATPTVTTTYHLTVTNVAGCTASDSITVTVLPLPDVDAGKDVALCAGESTRLRATGGDTYRWSPEVGLSCDDCADPVATPSTTTTYHVTATNAAGCKAGDSVTVTIIDAASVNAGQPQMICLGKSTQLQASDGATWKWSPAEGLSCTDCRSPIASPKATTLYTVTISAAGGCEASDTVSVTVLPLPAVSAGEDVEICAGGTAQLHATGGVSYRWSPSKGLSCTDCPDPLASLSSSTSFTVTATNKYGCTASDEVTVTVGSGRTVTAHIERSHHVLPGASTVVPVLLNESLGSIDTLLFSLNYNRGILRLRDIETVAMSLDGWQREVIADTLGGISLRFVAAGGRVVNAGELLALRFDGYLGDTLGSALPFSITLPNQPCVNVATSQGLILLDSICGLSYRLIAVDSNAYVLKAPTPNPFNPTTTIEFSLGLDGATRLEILNGVGEVVAVLVDAYMQPGIYEATWNASAMPSGLYYVRLASGTWLRTTGMVLVK